MTLLIYGQTEAKTLTKSVATTNTYGIHKYIKTDVVFQNCTIGHRVKSYFKATSCQKKIASSVTKPETIDADIKYF